MGHVTKSGEYNESLERTNIFFKFLKENNILYQPVTDKNIDMLGGDFIAWPSGETQTVDIKNTNFNQKYGIKELVLEEMSNSLTNIPGWLLKDGNITTHIYYLFWAGDIIKAFYILDYKALRKWFIKNYKNYKQIKTRQRNRTTSRLVSIKELQKLGLCSENLYPDFNIQTRLL